MKKLLYYLTLAFLLQACEKSPTTDFVSDDNARVPEVLSDGAWERLADYKGRAPYHNAGFGIGNKGYIGTGYFGSSQDEFWEYDLLTNSWAQKANFGGGERADAVGFSIGNKGYLFGGTGDGGIFIPFNDLWEYDPVMNTWTKKADLPGKGRYYAVAFTINSYGYVATGGVVDTINNCPVIVGTDELWEYRPLTDTWAKKAPFGGGPRADAAAFSIGDKGYLGVGYGLQGIRQNDFWEYDAKLNKWARKADYGGVGRTEAVALGINSLKRGYLGFGFGMRTPTDGGPLTDFWEYNPATDKWTQRSSPEGGVLRNAVSFNFGDAGYFVPVSVNGNDNQFWKFDPLK